MYLTSLGSGFDGPPLLVYDLEDVLSENCFSLQRPGPAQVLVGNSEVCDDFVFVAGPSGVDLFKGEVLDKSVGDVSLGLELLSTSSSGASSLRLLR